MVCSEMLTGNCSADSCLGFFLLDVMCCLCVLPGFDCCKQQQMLFAAGSSEYRYRFMGNWLPNQCKKWQWRQVIMSRQGLDVTYVTHDATVIATCTQRRCRFLCGRNCYLKSVCCGSYGATHELCIAPIEAGKIGVRLRCARLITLT